MSDNDDPDRSQPDAQLAEFEKRLNAKLEARRAQESKYDRPNSNGWAIGFRYGTEFIVGVLVGAALGFLVDRFLGIAPFGILIGTLIGFGAGTLNVVRAAKELGERSQR
ncbi:AtpZ/AtpI family protein [Hyphobacterium sp. HN65]|uniref:ATP synthase protein I n=1 Tax=Hyphobacterium lacteum TaxID=3116575 RepID=A0ABU7LN25_9PROT|nr:AtpZ/AtpI family protein [Hyphobacterium sp. HN65]MEE2525282.1 AtpZ/AtpI family protein [Hyphobacterium sp. HN65]